MDKTKRIEQVIHMCAQHFLYCVYICHCHTELVRTGLHFSFHRSFNPSIHPQKILKLKIFFKEPTYEEWAEEEMEEVSISVHKEEISEGTSTIQEQ